MTVLRYGCVSFFLIFLMCACSQNDAKSGDSDIVEDSSSMNHFVSVHIQEMVAEASRNKGALPDSMNLDFWEPLNAFYKKNEFKPVWCSAMHWSPLADSLMNFIHAGMEYGLFPDDYGYEKINAMRFVLADGERRKDAVLWSKAELLHTNAFLKIVRDLAQGRMQDDSASWHHNEQKIKTFFLPQLETLLSSNRFNDKIFELQPKIPLYHELRRSIKGFVDTMNMNDYTYVQYSLRSKGMVDSLKFIQSLRDRLAEELMLDKKKSLPDSSGLAALVVSYQKMKNWEINGLVTEDFVSRLNNTDLQKFYRLAVNLDRYKQMSGTLPERYIWVNLPGYNLTVWNKDKLMLDSRIICGKPWTPTPLLRSDVSDLVIYPTWTVPSSIISGEMLPGLKRNSGYLSKRGMYLINENGKRINPDSVNWSRYIRNIPYRIQQGSGDGNALGVIKFNFSNSYAVYLHDTNQRHLFENKKRALSHGCVRVQEWRKLAEIILREDSAFRVSKDTVVCGIDSVNHWLDKKQSRQVTLKKTFPLLINYFSCSGEGNRLVFFDDIYKLDAQALEKYFIRKQLPAHLRKKP